MATPDDVLTGVAAAMEDVAPDLTTALPREADRADTDVEFPHGDITVVSDNRDDEWNSDVVGYALDDNDNKVGYLLDAKFDAELQLNVWIAVPSNKWDIQSLGSSFARGLRKYDENRKNPAPLPDGSGGTLDQVENFRILSDGELPTEGSHDPPLRGYQVTVSLRYTDRINTADEYGEEDYVDTVVISEQ